MKLLLVIAVFIAADECVNACGGGSGNSGNSGWGWDGGPQYTFSNGIYVKATGPIKSPTAWIGYSTRFKRQIENTTTHNDKGKDDCSICLKMYSFTKDVGGRIAYIEQRTKLDLVLKAQLNENNIVKSKSHISIVFDVMDVYKTSDKSIEPGETLSIDADIADCPCLPTLTGGDYIITGKIERDGKLYLNGELYHM